MSIVHPKNIDTQKDLCQGIWIPVAYSQPNARDLGRKAAIVDDPLDLAFQVPMRINSFWT